MTCRRLLVLGALLVGSLKTVEAAPAVVSDPVRPSLSGYTNAASRLDANDWGSHLESETTSHLILRLDRSRAMLVVSLPPDTPETAAKQWLQETADALGWSAPRLTLHPQPSALILKVEGAGAVAGAGPTSSRLRIDLKPLTAGLRRLSPNRIQLCVRLPGARARGKRPG